MNQIIFEHEEYQRLEVLLMQGYHYNTNNSCVTREVRTESGMQTDVWFPQNELLYKHWFTKYCKLDLIVWYDPVIELVGEDKGK